MRASGSTEERKCRRWGALGVGLRVIASQDRQKGGFAGPWVENCYGALPSFSGYSGQRTIHALEVPTIPAPDYPVNIF